MSGGLRSGLCNNRFPFPDVTQITREKPDEAPKISLPLTPALFVNYDRVFRGERISAWASPQRNQDSCLTRFVTGLPGAVKFHQSESLLAAVACA
jgi:hypothetical protein